MYKKSTTIQFAVYCKFITLKEDDSAGIQVEKSEKNEHFLVQFRSKWVYLVHNTEYSTSYTILNTVHRTQYWIQNIVHNTEYSTLYTILKVTYIVSTRYMYISLDIYIVDCTNISLAYFPLNKQLYACICRHALCVASCIYGVVEHFLNSK